METNAHLEIKLSDVTGQTRIVSMKKGQYQSIGLEFETYLMDKQHILPLQMCVLFY